MDYKDEMNEELELEHDMKQPNYYKNMVIIAVILVAGMSVLFAVVGLLS